MSPCGPIERLPAHVGIIPDGNRRWAKRNNTSFLVAYNRGYTVLRETLERLLDLGVRNVSLYLMSRDNCLKRSRSELLILEELAVRGFRELRNNEKIRSLGVRALVLGDLSILSDKVRSEAQETTRVLGNGDGSPTIYLALCYGGRWEVEDSLRRGATPASLSMPPLDLIIRTGWRRRLSDFFPLASSYAELYFTDILWPDFSEEELCKALRWYSSQERLFGR